MTALTSCDEGAHAHCPECAMSQRKAGEVGRRSYPARKKNGGIRVHNLLARGGALAALRSVW